MDNPKDVEAVDRLMLFSMGLVADPIVFGKYPAKIKELVGNRLI